MAVPSTVLPFKNCTEPVALDGVTVAARVTIWPNVEADGVAVSVALVDALLTVSWIAFEVLPESFASPL